MNRREFLQCAGVMLSGISTSNLGFALSEEQKVYLATAANYTASDVDYFSEAQRQVVAAIAEVIIPRTETPGAIDAGVPRYIELMVSDWLNDEERKVFTSGLADLMSVTETVHGSPFDQLKTETQLQLLEALEDSASDSSWYDLGNTLRDFDSDAPFICQIKELTIWGFFTSEVGATQVLRYDPMPMNFDGDVPLGKDDSSWASGGFF